MVEIGHYTTLKVVKEVDFGVYLDGEQFGEILLPKRYVPETCEVGKEITVFIYLDSEDKLIATTLKPIATVDEFAFLEVKAVDKVGAFLDWGLPKDLLLPFREQKVKPRVGQRVLVYIYLDKETRRLAASAKLDKFLDNIPPAYEPGDEVDIIVGNETDIGYKVIINQRHSGILYRNEVFRALEFGESTRAFIKKIREDEKIDLTLQKPGVAEIDDSSGKILSYLEQHGGTMQFSDKSPADEIGVVFGMSKKNFKKALGKLYREKKVTINPEGVNLV